MNEHDEVLVIEALREIASSLGRIANVLEAVALQAEEKESDPPCPGCGKDFRDRDVPCCNPDCGGEWGTNCWHCHGPPHHHWYDKRDNPLPDFEENT